MASILKKILDSFRPGKDQAEVNPEETRAEEENAGKKEGKRAQVKEKISNAATSAAQKVRKDTARDNDDEEETEKKDEDDSPEKKETPASSNIRSIMGRVIQPEERTLKNYLSPSFWLEKNSQYQEMREKEKQDLNVYAVLSDGSRPTVEYYVLTILSCIIATIGLIQGSTAVIIGAMIIAPLMTPILALSLGVIWGDLSLMRVSVVSIFKGVFWAVVISALIALIIPMASYSSEIMARTRPSLFDIMVALASGTVGAYGYANKKISNTLIGIAIAVALMPPLCTIGIGIGTMNREVTTGATILFLINLISIGLAGAAIFWAMKIHPITADAGSVKRRALSQIVISMVLLVSIAVPVGFYMYEGYAIEKAESVIKATFEERMNTFTVHDMQRRGQRGDYIIDLTLAGPSQPDRDVVMWVIRDLKQQFPMVECIYVNYIQTINPQEPVRTGNSS